MHYSARSYRFEIALVLGATLGVAIFAYIYVSKENGVYLWDYRGYWNQYGNFAHYIRNFDVQHILEQLGGILKYDYNITPILPLQPAALIFGDNRVGYIIAIIVFYLTSAAMICTRIAVLGAWPPNGSGTTKKSFRQEVTLLFVLALTFAPFWVPSLRGLPDIIGLIPLGVATLMVLTNDFSAKYDGKRAIALGILIWAPFLFRRWYAYSIVAFSITSFLYSVSTCEKRNIHGLRRIILTYLSAGAVALACALVFQSVLIIKILHSNYGDEYEAFQVEGRSHLESFVTYFGPMHIALAVGGLVAGVSSQQNRTRALYFVSNALLYFFLFTRVQELDSHHYLPLAYWLLLLELIAIRTIFERGRWIETGGATSIWLVVFLGTLFGLPQWAQVKVDWILPRSKQYALTFPNLHNYDALLTDIRQLTSGSDKLTALGFGYHDVMSDELIYALTGQESKDWLVRTAHVDKRDGLRIEPFLARYAVVVDPNGAEGISHPALPPWPIPLSGVPVAHPPQDVENVPARQIFEARGIGAAYNRLPTAYQIGNGATAYIFEKKRPFAMGEVDALLSSLIKHYPSWKSTEGWDRAFMTGEMRPGDKLSNVQIDQDKILIWPGKEGETVFSFRTPNSEGFHHKSTDPFD